MADQIEIDLSEVEEFEAGAAFIAVLAYPNADDEARGRLMATYCHLVLKGEYLDGGDAGQIRKRLIKPLYAFRSDDEMQQDLKKVRRLLRDRMIAARMAMPLILRAEGNLPTKLPEGLSTLSLNELSVWAMKSLPRPVDDDTEPESSNIETRIWRPSLPVIHLAAALQVIMQRTPDLGGGELSTERILIEPWITKAAAELGERYADMIEKGGVLPGKRVDLIRFRLVSG